MKIRNFRSDNTHYDTILKSTEYYCPNCGKQEIFEELGDGDYYQGPSLYCHKCNFMFAMPSRGIVIDLNWIREGII